MARKMVVVACLQCGKEFKRMKKWVDSNNRLGRCTYCSKKCIMDGRKNGQRYNCHLCGIEFYRNPSEAEKTKSGLLFCSKQCSNRFNNSLRTEENHPRYKNGIAIYRRRALEARGARCTVCGYNIEEVLEVHHKDGNREHNEIDNLDVLCPTHHVEFECGIRKYTTGHSSNFDRTNGFDPLNPGLNPGRPAN